MTTLTGTTPGASRSGMPRKTLSMTVGTRIRAKSGVVSPDFDDISFAGWTGKIVEVSGKKPPYKYFIEWEDSVVAAIPQSYIDRCEAQQIYYRWACLSDMDIEPCH
mgnify:CR=1 FL=1